LPNSYDARHWLDLMRLVPVFALSRPRDLARIGESCALVEALID
jgi:hypothetical protein